MLDCDCSQLIFVLFTQTPLVQYPKPSEHSVDTYSQTDSRLSFFIVFFCFATFVVPLSLIVYKLDCIQLVKEDNLHYIGMSISFQHGTFIFVCDHVYFYFSTASCSDAVSREDGDHSLSDEGPQVFVILFLHFYTCTKSTNYLQSLCKKDSYIISTLKLSCHSYV